MRLNIELKILLKIDLAILCHPSSVRVQGSVHYLSLY